MVLLVIIMAFFAAMKRSIVAGLIGDTDRKSKDSDKRDRWTEIHGLITSNGCKHMRTDRNGDAFHIHN